MSSSIPRPEHPRPDFERKAWQCLNGKWQFAIDTAKCGLEKNWSTGVNLPLEINVPFCPESKLSGVQHTDFLEAVWYRRMFTVDKALMGQRLLLHFGAVDYESRVWVNGKQIAHHRGGWTPFSTDITNVVKPGENEVVVYAVDDERPHIQPLGKQSDKLGSYSCLYTRSTGIWQSVWLEAVPESRISYFVILPDAPNGRAVVNVDVVKPYTGLGIEAVALVDGKVVASTKLRQAGLRCSVTIDIPDPVLWEVGKPFLYDLQLRLTDGNKIIDEVSSYFGLREIRIDGDKILINGKSVFQRLILDQGLWPDGIYTAHSDEELKADIERSMACGFNGARLHQKVFEPRSLYWADKLGYIVWGEFPDWGCAVKFHAQARENMCREWTDEILRDINHPSIVAWMPLNEAHSSGERHEPTYFIELYNLTKKLDPTRPFLDASGYTHAKTEIWDLHDYEQDPAKFRAKYEPFANNPSDETLPKCDPNMEPDYEGQPMIVSEYGGIWWNPAQVGDEAWGYGDRPKDEREFIDRFKGLADVLLDNPHMAGLCYTQLTDVEQEVNGLYTYSRKPKFPPEVFKKILDRKAAIED
jgi:beta-galactosidase/beta-glucuronidase